MNITRRRLLVLAAAGLGACAEQREQTAAPLARSPVDAGSISDFARDGAYSRWARSHGFFIIRKDQRLFAQSAICTHRACPLRQSNGGFLCPCHGSTFTIEGHVTQGPATRDLPRLRVERSDEDHVIVHPEMPILGSQPMQPDHAFIAL